MHTKRYRILIVDDEPMIRDLAVRVLDRNGFDCDVAEDGQIAAEKFSAEKYRAIVTDLNMPNRDGYSLACELLTSENQPVIVVVTAVRDTDMSCDLAIRGICQLEYKPVDYNALSQRLKKLISRKLDLDSVGSVGSGMRNDARLFKPADAPFSEAEIWE